MEVSACEYDVLSITINTVQ